MRLTLAALFILFLCGCGAEPAPASTAPPAPPAVVIIPAPFPEVSVAVMGPGLPPGFAIDKGLYDQFPLPVNSIVSYKSVDIVGNPWIAEVYVYGGAIDAQMMAGSLGVDHRSGRFMCRGLPVVARNGLRLYYDVASRAVRGEDGHGHTMIITNPSQE